MTEKNVLLVSSVAFLERTLQACGADRFAGGSGRQQAGHDFFHAHLGGTIITGLWFSLAAKVFAPLLWLVLLLQVLMGLGLASSSTCPTCAWPWA